MKLLIPTDLSEITLGQLQSLTKLEVSGLNELELQKRTIELLTTASRLTIDQIKLNDLNEIYNKLLGLTRENESLHKFTTINNIKYGFHPNLFEMSTGEFADLDTLCKDLNDNLHLIIAILYRPVIKEAQGKYSIESYDGELEARSRIFKKNMKANVVNSALIFFWTIGEDYLNASLTCLSEEVETKNSKTSA